MTRDVVVVFGVDTGLAMRIEELGRGEDLELLRLGSEFVLPLGRLRVALVVLQAEAADALFEAARAASNALPGTPIVAVTREPGGELAFALSRMGVQEIIAAGAPSDAVARRCLSFRRAANRVLPDLVGRSEALRELRTALCDVAPMPSGVLITGPTGSGKGVIARAIHGLSGRAHLPFVHLDCASLSPTVIESELFGHEKGAFTGAAGRRAGRFEEAASGTIFLDEIGELPGPLQSKFLRVLEDRRFERVGGSQPLPMEARVIAATSRNLDRDVEQGAFRADLYYRLRIIHLQVPPLVERIEDVPELVRFGLARLCKSLGLEVPELAPGFLERLARHDWPGNVRELLNTLESALVRHRGPARLEASHLCGLLPESRTVRDHTAAARNETAVRGDLRMDPEADRRRLEKLLIECGGNVARVARRCGIPRTTIRHRIRRHDLTHLIPSD